MSRRIAAIVDVLGLAAIALVSSAVLLGMIGYPVLAAAPVSGNPLTANKPKAGAVKPPTAKKIPKAAAPTISSINPAGGPAGTTVTINGTGYAAGATVSVGDAQLGTAQATKVTVASPTQITAVVPPGRSLSANVATMVNVQVTVAGQTTKAILFSYCSNVTEFDPTRNKCVPLPPTGVSGPPQCTPPLVFNTAQNKCVPAPPLVCPDGQIAAQVAGQVKCIPQPAGTFGIVQFVIGTGGDDLQAGDQAWAKFSLPNGSPYTCTLHAPNADAWNNNSTHTAECFLRDRPMTLAQLRNNKIVISYSGSGAAISTFTITNPIPTEDNWNLQSITINAYNQGQSANCVFSASGNPLYRFTNSPNSGFSVTVTDFPNACP